MKRFYLSFALSILLVGCAGHAGVKGLQEKTQLFQQSIRWSSMSGATALMDPYFREDLMNFYGTWMDQNKTVEYSIVATQLNEAKNKAEVWVEFSYYPIVNETLIKRRQKQTWAYNNKAGSWLIQAVSQ